MRRLKLYMLLFGVALALPLGYLVLRTHQSLEREEEAELRFFAETLFDAMEQELALFVRMEELRPIDAYTTPQGPGSTVGGEPAALGIVGYLQNNPDGTFLAWTPQEGLYAGDSWIPGGVDPGASARLVALEEVNSRFNAVRKETVAPPEREQAEDVEAVAPLVEEQAEAPKKEQALFGFEPGMQKKDEAVENGKEVVEHDIPAEAPKQKSSVADKYLDQRSRKLQAKLGESKSRVEQVTPQQMLNLDPFLLRDESVSEGTAGDADMASAPENEPSEPEEQRRKQLEELEQSLRQRADREAADGSTAGSSWYREQSPAADEALQEQGRSEGQQRREGALSLQAEVDPMQSIVVGGRWIFLFRRIVIERRIYRQGLVLEAEPFLEHLLRDHFAGQPMSRFARLVLAVADPVSNGGGFLAKATAGASLDEAKGALHRVFSRPFSFLSATLSWQKLPPSPARNTLALVSGVLALIMLAGLYAVYRSARIAHEHSQRRAGFVSSVTHELKTPLTNIRLYVEMLEQGMDSDEERRKRYFRTLDSETGRLSRLIQNVLEFSKLERRQRRLHLAEGDLVQCAREAAQLMQEKLRLEGFELDLEAEGAAPARFDREAMLQVLLNLLENSVKFSADSPVKKITMRIQSRGRTARIEVSDTGPGITRQALKKVFEDFFREDNSLTRKTQGTGIGLALVRRFVESMGGEVSASNNHGAGCTISITLPGPEQSIPSSPIQA